MEDKNAIEVNNLSLSIDGQDILDDISFVIPKNTVNLIIGPNGSGKTTLIRTLVGLVDFKKGDISILGMSPKEARTKIGYVPQKFIFDKSFPIKVGEFLKFSFPHITDEKIDDELFRLSVRDLKDTLLGSLSYGQLQRILIARSVLNDPDIIYFDEPSNGIDVGGEKNFYDLISHLRQEHNTTIVMVSHEMDVVYRFADNVICLNKKLLCEGSPQEVLKHNVFEKLYGKDVAFQKHNKDR